MGTRAVPGQVLLHEGVLGSLVRAGSLGSRLWNFMQCPTSKVRFGFARASPESAAFLEPHAVGPNHLKRVWEMLPNI